MITRRQLEENWDDVKSCLQKRWGHLTDEELQQTRGDRSLLVGALERRTGLSRGEIEEFLEDAVGGAASMMRQAADEVSYYAEQAAGAVRDQYGRVREQAQSGYEQGEQVIRQRPMQSAAVAFGAGIVTGLLLTALSRSER